MRARAFALRDAFPDVLRGVHSVEEVQDFLDVHGHEMSQEEVAANGAAQVSSTVEVQNQPHQEKTELEPPVEAAPHEEPQSREQNDGSASTDSSFYPQDEFEKNFAKWSEAIRKGRQTADKLEKWVKGRNVVLTKEQKARLVAVESEVQQEIEAA